MSSGQAGSKYNKQSVVPQEEKGEGRNAAELCAASGPEAEVTGLAFLIKPVWKDVGLHERKYTSKHPFDCESGGSEPLPEPSKIPRERRFSSAKLLCACYYTMARKSQRNRPVSWSYWADYELPPEGWNRGAETSPERCTQRWPKGL